MKHAKFKMCIFGDGGVGKTTLINRFITGKYSENFKMTIGVDFYTKNLEIDNTNVGLQIWDFAGEQQFQNLLPNYVIGASGGIFMYDISRFFSLTHLEEWMKVLRRAPDKLEKMMPIIVVGGKKDLIKEGKRVVEYDYAMDYIKKFNLFEIIECSSKTGENVEQIFISIAKKMLEISSLY